MTTVISLHEVKDAIDGQPDNSTSYLNPETGEILLVTENEEALLETGIDEGTPDWQRDLYPKIKDAVESQKWLELPDKFDVHEWEIMNRFALQQRDEKLIRALSGAIRGRGAFRRFRLAIEELGLLDQWHKFRDTELEQIAREWLEENHLQYR